MIATNSYDDYGIPAATNMGRFGYTGQAWLAELGMSYYKARIYSPTLGRFLQTDPIGYADGLNWYNYVGSDPVNGRDPSGLEEDEIVITEKRFKATESFSNFDFSGTGGFSFGSGDPCSGPLGVLCDGGGGTSGEAGEILVTAARAGKREKPGAGPAPQRVDCKSTARQVSKVSSAFSNGFGTSAAAMGVLGAEPPAAFLGAVAVGADLTNAAAGVYEYVTEGDASILRSSITGKAVGFGASLYLKAAAAIYRFTPSSAKKIALEYAGEQLGGAVPQASQCPN